FVALHFGLDIALIKNRANEINEFGVTLENDNALKVFGDKGEKLPANAFKGFDAVTSLFEQSIATVNNTNDILQRRYKVAVVDLMILKRQKLGAFQLTKDIGADGLEVDMGGLGNRPTFDTQLLIDSVRKQFLDKARELHLEIPSLAMTGYYAQSFCQREAFIQSIQD